MTHGNLQYACFQFGSSSDTNGNAELVWTGTGIWVVSCDAKNRPASFRDVSTGTLVECAYDCRGRRCAKKVSVAGTVTLHERYIYRDYLQIACVDLTRSGRGTPTAATSRKTSAKSSAPPATSARATVTRRSARSRRRATFLSRSNGRRSSTTPSSTSSTTTTATTPRPTAAGFPATPSRSKAEGIYTRMPGIVRLGKEIFLERLCQRLQ